MCRGTADRPGSDQTSGRPKVLVLSSVYDSTLHHPSRGYRRCRTLWARSSGTSRVGHLWLLGRAGPEQYYHQLDSVLSAMSTKVSLYCIVNIGVISKAWKFEIYRDFITLKYIR